MLDIIYDFNIFFSEFYIYLGISLSFIPLKPIKKTKKMFKVKQQQDITLNRNLKKGSIQNLDGFLKTTKKILKKKKQLAYDFKQKLNIDKQNFKTIVIKILSNSGRKKLPTSTLAPTFKKNVEDVTMLGTNAYCLAC